MTSPCPAAARWGEYRLKTHQFKTGPYQAYTIADHWLPEVQRILTSLAIPVVINERLVRGLDYYEKTAFEFTHGALGAQNAILGGGRYDGLSETLGGPRAPGIGFAIGEDRLVLSLGEPAEAVSLPPDAYVAPLGPGMDAPAARLARVGPSCARPPGSNADYAGSSRLAGSGPSPIRSRISARCGSCPGSPPSG